MMLAYHISHEKIFQLLSMFLGLIKFLAITIYFSVMSNKLLPYHNYVTYLMWTQNSVPKMTNRLGSPGRH